MTQGLRTSRSARRSPPKPSKLYPVLWQFAAERQRIYLRRLADEPPPWTDDPVLSAYRFTNAFRATDRVSQYLIRMAYADPAASDQTLFLRTLLFKTFNRLATWEHIVNHLGPPSALHFDYEACADLLSARLRAGTPHLFRCLHHAVRRTARWSQASHAPSSDSRHGHLRVGANNSRRQNRWRTRTGCWSVGGPWDPFWRCSTPST